MKIGIYNEPGGGVGGTEYSVAVLAQELAREHQVEIIHHHSALTAEKVHALFGIELPRVRFRLVERDSDCFGNMRLPWRRYSHARSWHAELSKPYDLFISFVHGLPPFCHAPNGVLVVLFPLFRGPNHWTNERKTLSERLCGSLHRLYNRWEWHQRFAGYQHRVAISDFAANWTHHFWGIECGILYPPVQTATWDGPKARQILSVGRFTQMKKQLELVRAFRQLSNQESQCWHYTCCGGLGSSDAEQAYFRSLQAEGAQLDVQFKPNLGREEVLQQYRQASIFWHGTGYGLSPERPELTEHFGIVTVEAMAAGCVPVVYRSGGQPEIVEHGISGFLWDTPDELQNHTLQLIREDDLRFRMAAAARNRARQFSTERYLQSFQEIISHC